ncbi:hypothetical protein [Nostoc sp.]
MLVVGAAASLTGGRATRSSISSRRLETRLRASQTPTPKQKLV